MNSATGLEFAYTQAPPSMKSVVQSFWLLTTCVGNIIDIFFVEIKLAPTQVNTGIVVNRWYCILIYYYNLRLVNISSLH